MASKSTESTKIPTFSKEKILRTSRYKERRDLLSSLLEEGKAYTFKEVDAILEKFLKGEVK